MTGGKLAVIGLGSIGSMASWQASRLSDSITGFEAARTSSLLPAAGPNVSCPSTSRPQR